VRSPDALEGRRRDAWVMTFADTYDVQAENAALRDHLKRLQAENVRLGAENRYLRGALDAHIRRACSTSIFGPLELTPGTCVGPHQS
jgi:hypothetical protein